MRVRYTVSFVQPLMQKRPRQQAITWANVDQDLCRHMASLGHNELLHCGLVKL